MSAFASTTSASSSSPKKKRGRAYPYATKVAAVKAYSEGPKNDETHAHLVLRVANEFGVSKQSLYNWVSRAKSVVGPVNRVHRTTFVTATQQNGDLQQELQDAVLQAAGPVLKLFINRIRTELDTFETALTREGNPK